MRNKILKLAFRFSAFAFAVGMTGCDALDLAPIDTYGSGNFLDKKRTCNRLYGRNTQKFP